MLEFPDTKNGHNTDERTHAPTNDEHTETDKQQQGLYGDASAGGADIQPPAAPATDSAISGKPRSDGSTRNAEPGPLILTSLQFTEDFTPPDYLIDGLAQRRFLYSLTGNTGAGKTAIALRLAAHVALGRPLGDYEVETGRVLYFAGENPDDLRMRWIALSEQMAFDRNCIDVHFVVGADKEISRITDQIKAEVAELGGVALVIVDTSAAYFNCNDCKDENDNVQAGNHARMFRSLTELGGGPSIVVLAHPVKNAGNDNLLPRGRGAFLNEVDGNLVLRKDDALADLHWQGKFRGPEFEPISFQLHSVTAAALKDSKGRPIRTVLAVPLSDEDRAALEASQDQDGNAILALMSSTPGLSLMELAKALGWWRNGKDQADKRRTQKGMERLKGQGLVAIDTGTKRFKLTKKGEHAAAALKSEAGHSVPNTVPAIQ